MCVHVNRRWSSITSQHGLNYYKPKESLGVNRRVFEGREGVKEKSPSLENDTNLVANQHQEVEAIKYTANGSSLKSDDVHLHQLTVTNGKDTLGFRSRTRFKYIFIPF